MITGRMKCARCRWIRRRESGYHVASASWLKRCGRSLSLGDLAGTVRVWLCWWVDVGGGWSLVGVAEYGAQRGEDVYFPGQMQGVVVGGRIQVIGPCGVVVGGSVRVPVIWCTPGGPYPIL